MLEWLANWKLFNEPIQHRRYIRLHYEALLEPGELKAAAETLGRNLVPAKFSPQYIHDIVSSSGFSEIDINLKRDRKQREVKTAFCRKGVAGDFEKYLLRDQSAILKLLMT